MALHSLQHESIPGDPAALREQWQHGQHFPHRGDAAGQQGGAGTGMALAHTHTTALVLTPSFMLRFPSVLHHLELHPTAHKSFLKKHQHFVYFKETYRMSESLRLGKISKIIKSNLQPITAMPSNHHPAHLLYCMDGLCRGNTAECWYSDPKGKF